MIVFEGTAKTYRKRQKFSMQAYLYPTWTMKKKKVVTYKDTIAANNKVGLGKAQIVWLWYDWFIETEEFDHNHITANFEVYT